MSSPYSWEDTSGIDWGQTPGVDWSGSYDLPGLGGIGALSGGGGGSRELPGFLKGVKFLTDFTEKNFGPTGKYYNSASERAERRRTGSPSSSQIFDNFAYIPSPLASQFGGAGGMTVSGGGPSTTQKVGGAALGAGKGALSGFAAGGPIGAIAGATIGGLGGFFG
jgi:hypothetical protein